MNLEAYQVGYKDAFHDVGNILGRSPNLEKFKKSFDEVREKVKP